MYYVYLIKSRNNPDKTYIGFTTDLRQRLKKHNEGASIYTTDFRPWKLVTYICFDDESKAQKFEKYLKVGSGHVFAQRRFW